MHPDTQQRLRQRHAAILAHPLHPCDLQACPEEWAALLDTLCQCLQAVTDQGNGPQLVAARITRGDDGLLRWQSGRPNDYQAGLIDMARAASALWPPGTAYTCT